MLTPTRRGEHSRVCRRFLGQKQKHTPAAAAGSTNQEVGVLMCLNPRHVPRHFFTAYQRGRFNDATTRLSNQEKST